MTDRSARDPLLAELRDVIAELDPVPPDVVTAARGSLVWRTIDAELAELVEDSRLGGLVGVRGDDRGPRLLTFEAPGLTVVVEVGDEDSTVRLVRLVGQIVEPRAGSVEVRHREGSQVVDADDLGRFAASGVPSGPVSLVCRFADAPERPVATSWVTV